jgi:hypothetical protein
MRKQAHHLLARPDIDTSEGNGCALPQSELAALDSRHIQPRDGRWVFVDLVGKGNKIRTVPIPPVVLGNSIYERLATAPPVFRSGTPGSRGC